jgi:hypothetical protein
MGGLPPGGTNAAPSSADHRFHRLQDPRLSGVPGNNVLNAAYLVDAASIETFVALARSLDGDLADARVEITGPWPPYSFAEPVVSSGPTDTVDR